MGAQSRWRSLDEDGPDGPGDSDEPGNDSDDGPSSDSSDTHGDGFGRDSDGSFHGTSVIDLRGDDSNDFSRSQSAPDGIRVGGMDDNDHDGLPNAHEHGGERGSDGASRNDSTSDHWAVGRGYGETGFVSLGPIVLGGSYGGNIVTSADKASVSAGVFIGALGIAYALPVPGPSISVNYQSGAPSTGLTSGCDSALMLVTPIGTVMATAPTDATGDRQLSVSVSIGLTLGAGMVAGVYCGVSVDALNSRPPQVIPRPMP